MNYIFSPIGVSPHWFFYRQRMEELNSAINRYIEYIREYEHVKDMTEQYKLIAN